MALKLDSEHFKALLNTTQDGYWAVSPEGIILDVNEAYCEMSGYAQVEIIGESLLKFDIHYDPSMTAAQIEHLKQSGRGRFESTHRRKDGTLFEVEVSVSYAPIEGGILFSLLRDVTERHRQAQALLQERMLLETIINTIPSALFWKNRDGVFEGVNRRFIADSGLAEAAQIVGKSDFDMPWHAHAPSYRDDDLRIMQTQEAKLGYIEAFGASGGSERVIRTSKVPLRNLQGEVIGVLGIFDDISAEHRATEALKVAKEEFEAIFKTSKEGIAIMNLESRFLDFNPAYEALTGYSRAELLERSCVGMSTPEDRAATQAALAQAIQEGFVQNLQKSCIRKEGSVIFVSLNLSLLPDKKRLLMSVRDITEQKQHEARLEQLNQELEVRVEERTEELSLQKEAFERLFEYSSQGTLIIQNGRYIQCNAKVLEMIGVPDKSHIIGKTPSETSPTIQNDGKRSTEKETELINEAKAKGFARFEWAHTRPDGTTFPCEVTLVPIYLPSRGEIMHVTWRDLSEEKRKEQLLEESREYLNNIMESAIDGIVAIDAAGMIQTFNKAAEALFGFSREEVIGRNVSLLMPEPHQSRHDGYISAYLRSGVAKAIGHTLELEAQRKDGTRFPISLRVGEIKTPTHHSFTALLQDISQRKAVEAAMLLARQEAEQAAKTKADFLANMSHEIRTPLNAIIGMSFLVMQTELDEKQYLYIKKIDSAANHLLGVINDILDYSKLESGKMVLDHSDFDFNAILDNISNMFSFKVQEKEIELLYDIDSTMPYKLKGDALRLSQVLINLVSNAVKFTNAGTIVLRSRLRAREGNKARISFSVKDTGIGMTAEQAARLFHSFSQVDTSATRRYEGTGLGLVISQHLVHAMQGTISARSVYGSGSTFSFEVELELQEEQPPLGSRTFTPMRVLIVDDNPIALEVIAKVTSSFHYETHQVMSGEQAISKMRDALTRNTPYDLLIIDYKMPGIDGLETIKQMEVPQNCKIVMVTSTDMNVLKERAEGLSIDAFLSKPLTPSSLYDAIVALQSRNRMNTLERVRSNTYVTLAQKIAGAHLLVVEDNKQNQEIAAAFLEKGGVSFDFANNGEEAVMMAQKNVYDGVLMDVQMPVMDGFEATRRLRGIEATSTLPIIAMTANALHGDRQRCLNAGMNDYVSKPIDINKLFEVLALQIVPKIHKDLQEAIPETADDAAVLGCLELDIKNALSRMGGSVSLFVTQARRFARSHHGFTQEIEALCAGADTEALVRFVHSLKGTSGSIGATPLFVQAKELEQHLKESGLSKENLQSLKQLSSLVAQVVNNIEECLERSETATQQGSLYTPQELRTMLCALKVQLQDFDAQAVDSLKMSAATLSDMGYEVAYTALLAQVEEFNFDEALELLEPLLQQLECVCG
ncbi:MAG: PAS domain S-box protein [Campylobacterales bacterium]|nr:PAS domain S-box protein [Campylobacterales bacterium]